MTNDDQIEVDWAITNYKLQRLLRLEKGEDWSLGLYDEIIERFEKYGVLPLCRSCRNICKQAGVIDGSKLKFKCFNYEKEVR